MMKTCNKCGEEKPLSDFSKKLKGLRELCRSCDVLMSKSRRVRLHMPDGTVKDVLWTHREPHINKALFWERYIRGGTPQVITATPTKNNLLHPELDRIRDERKQAYSKLDEADERARDGFVYIIEVPGQHWLKIGHARDPYQRVKGVKSFLTEDPKVRHMVYTDDRMRDEKTVHEALETYRHSSGKELFECGYELAKEVLDDNVGVRPRGRWVPRYSQQNSLFNDSPPRR